MLHLKDLRYAPNFSWNKVRIISLISLLSFGNSRGNSLVYTSLLLIITFRFTSGERNSRNHPRVTNILTMIAVWGGV